MASAYKGSEPYIFISYAHKDSGIVVPIIEALQARGCRIWFDEGIEAGTEWSNNIAAHLKVCSTFLAFVSRNSAASENCLDEIAYAKAHQKPSLMIFLEENVVLPEGTEMQTARFQRMFYNRHGSLDSFTEKLMEAPILESCMETISVNQEEKPAEPRPVEVRECAEEPEGNPALCKKICWISALLELSYCMVGPKGMELILNCTNSGWARFLLMIIPHGLIAWIIRTLIVKNGDKLNRDQKTSVFSCSLVCWVVASILAVIIGIFHVPLEINGLLKFLLALGLNVVPALVSVIIYFTMTDISSGRSREHKN